MLARERAQVARAPASAHQRPGLCPERNGTGARQKYRRRNKKIGQRSNNDALGLEEKSSKARHSPAVLINLIKKSRQAYESFTTLHSAAKSASWSEVLCSRHPCWSPKDRHRTATAGELRNLGEIHWVVQGQTGPSISCSWIQPKELWTPKPAATLCKEPLCSCVPSTSLIYVLALFSSIQFWKIFSCYL